MLKRGLGGDLDPSGRWRDGLDVSYKHLCPNQNRRPRSVKDKLSNEMRQKMKLRKLIRTFEPQVDGLIRSSTGGLGDFVSNAR